MLNMWLFFRLVLLLQACSLNKIIYSCNKESQLVHCIHMLSLTSGDDDIDIDESNHPVMVREYFQNTCSESSSYKNESVKAQLVIDTNRKDIDQSDIPTNVDNTNSTRDQSDYGKVIFNHTVKVSQWSIFAFNDLDTKNSTKGICLHLLYILF